ncbi:MAG: glycosyltransferase, partial [Leptolyngbyaceae cyanobacterium SM1_3_5]|nr:glycosyltransferase [Leptolyngbyaceae cyanobacterium SM1_3_5]
QRPVPNLNFVYVDPLGWVYDWSQEGKKAHWDVHLHYYLWQIWAYFTARSLLPQLHFDLVHHVSYVKYSNPSFLSLLSIPFVWGPVGGAESAPKSFWQDFSTRAKVYEVLRAVSRWVGEADPFVRLTAKRSALTWATTEDTASRVRQLGAKNVRVLIESGLRQEEIDRLMQYPLPETAAIRFISLGRLLHWKGFHLGLRAFAAAGIPNAEYWVVGDGPERDRLERLAADLGIADRVKFWGRVDRDEGLTKLGESHVLVHPSLHDSGGWVCLEAMAAGRPIVCLALGGPNVQVTPETGFKIPADHPDQAVQELAQAMSRLAQNRDLLKQMGRAGQQLVQTRYRWEAKVRSQVEQYDPLQPSPATFEPQPAVPSSNVSNSNVSNSNVSNSNVPNSKTIGL